VYTASDKPSADRYGGTDHPPRRRRHTRASAAGNNPGNAPRTPATGWPPTPKTAARNKARSAAAGNASLQSLHHNAAETAATTSAEEKTRRPTAHDGEKNASRRHRQQDAPVKPPAGHGIAAAGSKTPKPPAARSSPNTATHAPRKAPNTAPTCVETKKPKPRREVRRRVPKHNGSLRTSHLKRKPHHQVKHWNQRPPAPKTPLTSPTPNATASLTPSAQRRTSPTTPPSIPPQTQAAGRGRRHAAEAIPPSYPARQKPPRGGGPQPHLHRPPAPLNARQKQAKTRPQKRAQQHSRPRISLRSATPRLERPSHRRRRHEESPDPRQVNIHAEEPHGERRKKHAAANTSQRPHKPHQNPTTNSTAAASLRRPTLPKPQPPPHPSSSSKNSKRRREILHKAPSVHPSRGKTPKHQLPQGALQLQHKHVKPPAEHRPHRPLKQRPTKPGETSKCKAMRLVTPPKLPP
jgi:hypothetical protein